MADEILLNEAAYAVWQTVKERGPIELGDVAKLTGIDQSQVTVAASEAEGERLFHIAQYEREELIVTPGAAQKYGRLPEELAAEELQASGGELPIAKFVEWTNTVSVAPNDVFKWGAARGWIERTKRDNDTFIALTLAGQKRPPFDEDRRAVLAAVTLKGKPLYLGDLIQQGIDLDRVRKLLSNRPELARIKKRTERIIKLTDKGAEAFKSRVRKIVERNSLTPEDLESGAWKEIKLRPYDVKLAAKDVYPAKIHPLRKIIEQTRRAFLEMGFAEVVSPMVESAFWNFDALFQPQDHPARDMQDTFYMLHPATAPLPGEKGVRTLLSEAPSGPGRKKSSDPFVEAAAVVQNVKQTHENGWTTGSEGWGYTWSPERSKQVVLRTHTTAATVRALAANPKPPGKFFCVGWTYRNETISFKHLPVFHQVDGIIIDEEANLASLMGTLQEFYSKMGFGRVKFKPAFYPYTEPSVDVVVYMESRGKWLEMGGAGIFRPEVTLPLGCNYPVLAWGLGIERLAMLRFGLSDIRELYRPSLDALEEVPLCR
jgi:phenylalanyl-tRNA synthetase alpha chain